jgi:DNA invertase Pin-like site-specific DNA recombinase
MNCGYIRPVQTRSGTDKEAQLRTIVNYAATHGLSLAGYIGDEPDAARTRFLERPGGKTLSSRLKCGDQVVFARVSIAFRSLADLQNLLACWLLRGVTLHFARERIRLEPGSEISQQFQANVNLLINAQRELTSESCRKARARSKAAGTRFTGVAPYGTRWQGKGKRARLVEDPAEIATMVQIDQWKGEGLSYYGCWQRLLYAKQKTSAGREWSLERVKRAHKAYERHKAKLAEAKAGPVE